MIQGISFPGRAKCAGKLRAASAVISLWMLCALCAPALSRGGFSRIDLDERLRPPSRAHLLGTDDLGRDVLTRLLYGGRVSLAVAAASLLLAVFLGGAVGVMAGYKGGIIDMLSCRVIDILMSLPGILLAIAIVAYVGRGFIPLIFALSATAWSGYARLVRSMTLGVKVKDFVGASHALGASTQHIIIRHILPNTWPVLAVQCASGAAGVILSESSLSFLGLGVQPPFPSWGETLSTGCDYLLEAPHIALSAGVVMFSVIWSLYTVGEALSASGGAGWGKSALPV